MRKQMLDILEAAGDEVVHANDLIAIGNKAVTEV
jgi:hypothetical protein